jgi:flagellar biosynthesis protein FlhG
VAEVIPDQAAGLRRIFARSVVRTVALTSGAPGSGRSVVAANLACALGRRGRNVCLVEQGRGRSGVAELLGVRASGDLVDVIRRDQALTAVMNPGPEGIRLVRCGDALRLFATLPEDQEARLARAFAALEPPVDVLLVDTPAGLSVTLPGMALASAELVVVVSAEAESITGAYALMKRLSWDFARRRFHVLVTRVRSADQAHAVLSNLSRTAERYLGVKLSSLGWIPEDDAVRKAERLGQAAVSAFPDAPAARAVGAAADAILDWSFAGEDSLDGFLQRLVRASRIATLSSDA